MKRAWLAIPVLLLALAGAGWYAVHDRDASAWLLRRAAAALPGELAFEIRAGNLADGLELAAFAYRNGGVAVQAEELELAIAWRRLLDRRLQLQRLTADRLELQLPAAEPGARSGPLVLPDIAVPLELAVERLEIGRLQLDLAGGRQRLTGLRLSAELTDRGLDISELAGETRGLEVRLAGRLQPSGRYPLRLRLDWRLPAAGIGGAGTLAGDLQRLQIEQQLRLPDRVRLRGELSRLLDRPQAALQADWQGLSFPRAGLTGWRLGAGRLRLDGGLDGWQAELQSEFEAPQGGGQLAATLSGDRRQLRLQRLAADWAGAAIEASGEASLPALASRLNWSASGVDPGLFLPQLQGRIGGHGSVALTPGQSLAAVIDGLDGQLFGQRLTGQGRVEWAPGRWHLPALTLRVGDNRLQASATIAGQLTGRGEFEFPALAELWPGLGGDVSGRVLLAGDRNAPQVAWQADGRDLRFAGWRLAKGSLAGRLAGQSLAVELDGDELAFRDTALGRLRLAVTGRADAHRLRATLDGGALDISLAGQGRWSDGQWGLRLDSGAVSSEAAGRWRLDRPLSLAFGAGRLSVGAHCWRDAAASLCLDDSRIAPGDTAVAGRLQALPLALLQPLFAAGLELAGTASAEFQFRRAAEAMSLALQWEQSDSRLRYRADTGELLETRIDRLTLTAEGDNDALQLEGVLAGERGLAVRLAGSLDRPLADSAALALQLQTTLPDVAAVSAPIERFLPVQSLRGRLSGRLALTGRPRSPQLAGELTLLDGGAVLPAAGIELESVELRLAGRAGEPLQLSGRASSGGGSLLLRGQVAWSENTGLYADLHVGGRDFQALRFPDQTFYVSPDLRALVDGGRITVTGELSVPRAEIRLDELPQNAWEPSEDLVIHEAGAARQRPRPQWELLGAVRVLLGDDVRFSGFGLDSWLAGELLLTKPPGGLPPVAQGQLRTQNARFKAAGKELEVERGLLIFSGPVDRPTLDVRAVRRISWEGEEITAGVLLSGPSDAIKTRVFAEPAMSEADALSFLVLDRPVSAVQTGGSAELSNTALAFGLLRVLPITQQLEQGLGLDEVALEGSGGENTSLVAGKRIGRDLFIRYRYGLFNRIGTFLVRYRIGRGFSIEAGSGEQQSLELIYSVER